ncbi:MAG: hypothetical protein FD128_229 [Hyphomonadaceae bacterium]|nr:MAG: hypothetical protein FD128_229 [Hyphomonadaceae bacterium]
MQFIYCAYNKDLEIEFDPKKNEMNVRKHGISLGDFALMNFEKSIATGDDRYEYGEPRFTIFAPISGRLYCAIITFRNENIRVISLRKANDREFDSYGKIVTNGN